MEPTSQNTVPTSPAVLPSPASRDEVLGNTDILSDIVFGVDSPTTIVRAAAVSKFWRNVASNPASLRRFGDRHHHPLLLGYYLTLHDYPVTSFEKMPGLSEELAADVIRGSFDFGPGRRQYVQTIFDCRNGFVVTGGCALNPDDGYAIHHVLRPNGGPPVAFPRPPQPFNYSYKDDQDYETSIFMLDQAVLLPEVGGNDGRSCTAFSLVCTQEQSIWVHVSEFRAPRGGWGEGRRSNKIALPGNFVGLGLWRNFCLLTQGTAYMVGMRRQILALDLASMSLRHIELPQGVEFRPREVNLRLSRSDQARPGCNVVHVRGLQLRVWFYSTDADRWKLVDTVSLRQAFGRLANPVWLSGGAVCNLLAVGDTASFVFLQVLHELFYLHVPTRQVKKVSELSESIRDLYLSHGLVVKLDPVMMVWPPNFQQLGTGGDDEAQY
ncbi:hypothetical protein QOZ80_2AG0110240 [Eleusine coracana subsp. coracana]|nr:hypothetical protein QOZ80_2AG0110240 [Eleusine coracana subsp. coracana]